MGPRRLRPRAAALGLWSELLGAAVRTVDTAIGGLTLTFTDLALPGNAGHDLRFQRSDNSESGDWTFGLGAIVLRAVDAWPNLMSDPERSR